MLSFAVISEESCRWVSLALLWMVRVVEEVQEVTTVFFDLLKLLSSVQVGISAKILTGIGLKSINCGSLRAFGAVIFDTLLNDCAFYAGYLKQKLEELN